MFKRNIATWIAEASDVRLYKESYFCDLSKRNFTKQAIQKAFGDDTKSLSKTRNYIGPKTQSQTIRNDTFSLYLSQSHV